MYVCMHVLPAGEEVVSSTGTTAVGKGLIVAANCLFPVAAADDLRLVDLIS